MNNLISPFLKPHFSPMVHHVTIDYLSVFSQWIFLYTRSPLIFTLLLFSNFTYTINLLDMWTIRFADFLLDITLISPLGSHLIVVWVGNTLIRSTQSQILQCCSISITYDSNHLSLPLVYLYHMFFFFFIISDFIDQQHSIEVFYLLANQIS